MIEGISGKACSLIVSDQFRGGRPGTWALHLAQVSPLQQMLCIKVKSTSHDHLQSVMFQPPGLHSYPGGKLLSVRQDTPYLIESQVSWKVRALLPSESHSTFLGLFAPLGAHVCCLPPCPHFHNNQMTWPEEMMMQKQIDRKSSKYSKESGRGGRDFFQGHWSLGTTSSTASGSSEGSTSLQHAGVAKRQQRHGRSSSLLSAGCYRFHAPAV